MMYSAVETIAIYQEKSFEEILLLIEKNIWGFKSGYEITKKVVRYQ